MSGSRFECLNPNIFPVRPRPVGTQCSSRLDLVEKGLVLWLQQKTPFGGARCLERRCHYYGKLPNESFGVWATSAGDVNNDGLGDVIVGGPRFHLNGVDTGRAYIFYGPVSGSMIAAEADVIIFGGSAARGLICKRLIS
jgi:FG-GAP repeat